MRRARGCGGRFLNTKKKLDETPNCFNTNVCSEGGTTIDSSSEAGIIISMECGVESRRQESEGYLNTMHGLGNRGIVGGMNQSVGDGAAAAAAATTTTTGFRSGMHVQNGNPIISSGENLLNLLYFLLSRLSQHN